MAPVTYERRRVHGAASSTHHLATSTAMAVLAGGGNAFDAAVAVGFMLQVVEPHMCGPGGEVPAVFVTADDPTPRVLCGQGVVPARATTALLRDELGLAIVPGTGLLAATVPGAWDGWLVLLRDHGTRELSDVLGPALGYAADGFPLAPRVPPTIALVEQHFRRDWPSSAAAGCPSSRTRGVGCSRRLSAPPARPASMPPAMPGTAASSPRRSNGSSPCRSATSRAVIMRVCCRQTTWRAGRRRTSRPSPSISTVAGPSPSPDGGRRARCWRRRCSCWSAPTSPSSTGSRRSARSTSPSRPRSWRSPTARPGTATIPTPLRWRRRKHCSRPPTPPPAAA